MSGYMKKIVLTMLLAFSLVSYANSNDNEKLWDSVIKAKNYLIKDDYRNAEAIVNSIEGLCSECNNDSIKVVFLECKAQIIFFDAKDYSSCIPIFKEIIELYERLKIKSRNYLEAYQAIAYCYEFLGNDEEAERHYRKAIIKSKVIGHSAEFVKGCYLNLYNIYKERGDSVLANECLKYSKSDEELLDIKHMSYLYWANEQLDTIAKYRDNGFYSEAADKYINYIAGIKEKIGKHNKDYKLAIYTRAILLSRYLNKFDEAKPLFEEIISLRNDNEPCENYVCGSYCNLVLYYSHNGQYDIADNVISNCIGYFESVNDSEFPICSLYRFAGNGAYWKQDYKKAIYYYELYFANVEKKEIGTNYEEIANQLAVSYLFSDKPQSAQVLLKKIVLSESEKLDKENRGLLAMIYHNLGRSEMLLNNMKSAKNALEKSKELQVNVFGQVTEKTQNYLDEVNSKK